MKRRPTLGILCRWLATLCLLAACGCAQTRASRNPFAWLKKPDPAATADADDAPLKPEKDASSSDAKAGEAKVASSEAADKPATPPEPAAAETKTADAKAADAKAADAKAAGAEAAGDKAGETKTAEATQNEADVKTAAAKPAGDAASALKVHDAETLALIEDELQQATAEERDKLFAEWKSLDGAMVRQVIRIRKMVRELESASPGGASAIAAAAPDALPGSATPWTSPTGAASGASRVLPLGTAIATADASPAESEMLAVADAAIQSAAMNGASATPSPGAITTVGHATTRPVSVIDSLTGAATAATPSAASSPDSDKWQSQVRGLIAAAEMRADQASAVFLQGAAAASPADDATRRKYVESQVQLRLLYLMAGEQARAMQAIPGLEASEQEFWQQLLWSVANYFDAAAMPNRSDRFTQTVEQLRTAVARLQGDANLQMRNVAFCHKITSFGNFERFERDEYSPGQLVLLYAEIANFKSVPQASDGLYKTQIKSTIEIFRAGQGQPAKKMVFEPTVDLCRSHRQDYFHSYELKIPADLTLGPHVLKLTVEDMQSGKLATYSVNFTVK